MEYFQVRYDSRVVIYERKMFIRLVTGLVVMAEVSHVHDLSALIPFG